MTDQNEDPVLLTVDGHIATITLNAPSRRNAMSEDMTAAFPSAVARINELGDIRAVIVTGSGSAFCAGGDLDFLHTGERDVTFLRDKMTSFYPNFLSLLDLDIPTIAAINGPAIGAGLCLALMCDMRVASAEAPMGMTFVRIGLHPGMMATALLGRAVSHTWAAELLYTGRIVTGAEALHMGTGQPRRPSRSRHGRSTRARPTGRDERAARAPVHQARPADRVPRDRREVVRVGGLRAAGDDGDRGRAGRPEGDPREARTRVPRSLT